MQTLVQVAEELAEVVGSGAWLGEFPVDNREGWDQGAGVGGIRYQDAVLDGQREVVRKSRLLAFPTRSRRE